MKLGIGADHRGYKLKQTLKKYLTIRGYDVIDFGPGDNKPVDYPDTAFALAESLQKGEIDKGILICGSGLGMTIAANKVTGVRAALCFSSRLAKRAREHNDANILTLAGDFITQKQAKAIVTVFLTATFLGNRHQRRIEKITRYEARGLGAGKTGCD